MVDRQFQKSLRQLRFPIAPVVAVDELIDVFLQILVAHTMIGSQQVALEVGDGLVHLGQPTVSHLRRSDACLMQAMPGNRIQGLAGIGAALGNWHPNG